MRLRGCDLRVTQRPEHSMCGIAYEERALISNSSTSFRNISNSIILLLDDVVNLVVCLVIGRASLSMKTKLFTAL